MAIWRTLVLATVLTPATVLALATVVAAAMVAVGASPGTASASAAPHRPPRPGGHAGPGSGLTLAQAPAGLRAAVRRSLGVPAPPGVNVFPQAEMLAFDAATNDNFGWSVAISGSTAVVGAYNKNSATGAAYVFTHSNGTWFPGPKLTASDGAANDDFGYSVAASGSTVMVGAPGHNSVLGAVGAVYVFTGLAGTWSQRAELTASDGGNGGFFGFSVAMSGSTAVVGAIGSNSGAGAAYVFTGSGSTWTQQAKLSALHGGSLDGLGWSVAVSGSTAVAGAPGNNSNTGAAYVFTRSGSTWTQQATLTANGGASGDQFGISVALSGSTAVVGAPSRSSQTGAAYVFTGSGSTWTQQAKLTASDGRSGDDFGNSVAIGKSTMVVGAPGNFESGAAYVFTGSGSTWFQQAKSNAPDFAVQDFYGYSVAMSGSTVVTGAYGEDSIGATFAFVLPSQHAELTAPGGAAQDDLGDSIALSTSTALVGAPGTNNDTGAVYVFTRSGGTWSQQAKLTVSGGAAGGLFGSSVALSGSTAVIGAPGTNSDTGSAYVFRDSGGTWTRGAKLTASGGAAGGFFGFSVALSGSTAVAGAPGTNSNTGAAYVFARSGGAWSQQARLTASDGASGDQFGWSVALTGSTAVAGAFGNNNGTGAAYVFTGSGSTWSQQAKLTAPDGKSGDAFGESVALSGSTAVAGAFGTGAVYVFTGSGSAWTEQAELTASDGAAGDSFGISVAMSGSTLLVGADSKNDSTGAAYVFVRQGTIWYQQFRLTASDGAADDDFGDPVAISGSTAMVGAAGQNIGIGAAYVFVNA